MTLSNRGGPFKLKTKLKVQSSSQRVDDPTWHEYIDRRVLGGAGDSKYQIAVGFPEPHHGKWIQTERLSFVQKWELPWQAATTPVDFSVLMEFLVVDGESLLSLGMWSISARYLASKRRFEDVRASRLYVRRGSPPR